MTDNMQVNSESTKEVKPIVYLDKTVTNQEEDILGSINDAKVISKAIDDGAEMIAITSSFGAGKSTITDLLSELRKPKNSLDPKELIVRVSMWSLINEEKGENALCEELHRNLLYQIVSKLDPTQGSYIIRKLSPNYGLLKIQIKDNNKTIWFILSILMLLICWVDAHLYSFLPSFIYSKGLQFGMTVFSIAVLLFVLMSNEILFSSPKTRRQHGLGTDELIDIFKTDVIKSNTDKQEDIKRVIVVIEDLDRTNNNQAVRNFLVELRRFYVDSCVNIKNPNSRKVTFIVNLKNESELECEIKQDKLYEKIFDYIYDLHEVNAIDYEYVLIRLLEQKKAELRACGLLGLEEEVSNIDGLGWLTYHDDKLSIRVLKDRLNRSLSKYVTLTNRFGHDKEISFRKCAFASYFTTTYESCFSKTPDDFFETLIDASIVNGLKENDIKDISDKYLKFNLDIDYIKAAAAYVREGIIEDDYRLYFYNYPIKAETLNANEMNVQKMLLHGTRFDNYEAVITAVSNSPSNIINRSYTKLDELNKPLPDMVFNSEILYLEALKTYPVKVLQWIESLDYTSEGIDKTAAVINRILSFDRERQYCDRDFIGQICLIVTEKCHSNSLLVLRNMICNSYNMEIQLYSSLFLGTTPIITIAELDKLSLTDAISLINQNHSSFSENYLEYVNSRITGTLKEEEKEALIRFFVASIDNLLTSNIKKQKEYIVFLNKIKTNVKELADSVLNWADVLANLSNGKEVNSDQLTAYVGLIQTYVEFVNELSIKEINEDILNSISKLMTTAPINEELYFTEDIANKLSKETQAIPAIFILQQDNAYIPFNKDWVKNAIKNNIEVIRKSEYYFSGIRRSLLAERILVIKQYNCLFTEQCPILSETELLFLEKTGASDSSILDLLPPRLIDDSNYVYISEFFGRKGQNRNFAKKYFDFMFETKTDMTKKLFDISDFKQIPYYKLTSKNREVVKDKLSVFINLESFEGIVSFIEKTGSLDADLEMRLEAIINTNNGLRDRYFNAINSTYDNKFNSSTLKVIQASSKYYGLNGEIREVLFSKKMYHWYVSSKVLYEETFNYEPEKKEALWDSYCWALLENANLAPYMQLNKDFMQDAMRAELFKNIHNNTIRMRFASANQTKESLADIIQNYSTEYQVNYFSNMNGFADPEAADYFIQLVEKDNMLLSSNTILNNTYEKLLDWKLKSRYTRARHNAGLKGGNDYFKSLK